MDLVDGLVAVGALCDLERLRFEQTGALVESVTDDRVAVVLSEVSRHHAWRAAQWAELVRPPLPPLVAPRRAPVVDRLAPPQIADTAAVLGWMASELDDLCQRVEAVVRQVDPVGDGAVVRTSQRVLADLRSDQSLVSEPSR